MNGLQQAQAMARLAGVPITRAERLEAAEHDNAVLRECLEIAMRSLAFERFPTSGVDLRLIRDKLAAAGIEVKV